MHGLSPVAASRSYPPVGVCRLLMVGASLAVEFRFWGTQVSAVVVRGLQRAGSAVMAHRLSCPVPRGLFPGQELNLCP